MCMLSSPNIKTWSCKHFVYSNFGLPSRQKRDYYSELNRPVQHRGLKTGATGNGDGILHHPLLTPTLGHSLLHPVPTPPKPHMRCLLPPHPLPPCPQVLARAGLLLQFPLARRHTQPMATKQSNGDRVQKSWWVIAASVETLTLRSWEMLAYLLITCDIQQCSYSATQLSAT